MKLNTILTLFALVLCTGSAYSQSDSIQQREFKVKLGYQNFRILDENTSPLLYSADNAVLGFDYKEQNDHYFWKSGVSFSVGSNQSAQHGKRTAILLDTPDFFGNTDSITYVLNPALSFVQAELYTSFFRSVGNRNLHLGGIVFDRYILSGMGADTWFFNQLSLQPAVYFNHQITAKHGLTCQLSTTVFSYNLRQPYTFDPSLPSPSYFQQYLKTGSSFVTVNKFQQVDVHIAYNYSLKNNRKIGVDYAFTWMNNNEIPTKNLGAYANSLSLTYIF